MPSDLEHEVAIIIWLRSFMRFVPASRFEFECLSLATVLHYLLVNAIFASRFLRLRGCLHDELIVDAVRVTVHFIEVVL